MGVVALSCDISHLTGVKHRENMRFARTKLFGVFRSLFRAIGVNMVQLGLLAERQVLSSCKQCVSPSCTNVFSL